jgi:cobalt-zinc-cadmium efflux system protein
VAGAIILLTHWTIVDPLLSIGVALLVAVGAWNILHETTNILLEAAPKGISLGSLVQDMKDVKGVKDVHVLHVWSITSGMNALSCHILIDNLPMSASSSIRQSLAGVLDEKYHISHATIQFECDASKEVCCGQGDLYCQLMPTKQGAHADHHHEHE